LVLAGASTVLRPTSPGCSPVLGIVKG